MRISTWLAVLGAAALVIVAGCGSSSGLPSAPAFSSSDLAATPSGDWITNGGSLSNDRFSTLDQITSDNVRQLKGVWHVHLNGDGLAAKFSGEGQPLEYKGVIYMPTGENNVYAIDAKSGKILWEYKANLDPSISTVCCGWSDRGVAIGDGRVYLGQLDGYLVALDQKTGTVDWKHHIQNWRDGYTITAAPLYYDNLVITGISGAEFVIRGREQAYDATTGKLVWTFYTTPGPGQLGHDTWPQTGTAWKNGGASIWNTPSVDPQTGLLFFSTGNASPDLDGSQRAGNNLFTSSIVALHASTGKIAWWYQEVHHDLWDYDAPSPTVLFDATIDGKVRHGIGQPSKTGWLYLLDRDNGRPLFLIPERPVPQYAPQKTAATQPIPSYAPFVSHQVTPGMVSAVKADLAKTAAGAVTVTGAAQIYTPVTKTVTVITPGPQGGNNWEPSSYNPDTHMFYVCAQAGYGGYGFVPTTIEAPAPGKVQTAIIGGTLDLPTGFGKNPGTLTAIDATTGRIVWQHTWPESCYSGTTTTAGNLVFVGRNGGEYQAYNARTGRLLWSFQTGAGANSTGTVFEQGGQEQIAFFAGGNALAGAPQGDDLWLFGLNGTLGPAPAPGTGKAIGHAGARPQPTTGNAAAGKVVFAANCSTCHGATGMGGNGGPDLTTIPAAKNYASVVTQVENGGGGMPPFKNQLTQQQINDVATYVVKDITHGTTG